MIVGCVLLFVGLLLWKNTRSFVARAQPTEGVVIEMLESRDSDGDIMYRPLVRFTTPDGREVTVTGNASRPAGFSTGETVTVLRDPHDPHDSRLGDFKSLWLGPIILSGIGALFAAIAGGIFFAGRLGNQKKQYLLAYGNAIQTDVQGVERNTSLEVNGRNPWRITSQWLDPAANKLRVFHSENLWYDPQKFLNVKEVTVLLDPKNPKRYYMDISFLPEQA